MPESEVARLRWQLQAQAQAAWIGLYGLAEVGKQQFMTSKMERMVTTWQAMAEKMGEQEATQILIDIENRLDQERTAHLLHAETQWEATEGHHNGTVCP